MLFYGTVNTRGRPLIKWFVYFGVLQYWQFRLSRFIIRFVIFMKEIIELILDYQKNK